MLCLTTRGLKTLNAISPCQTTEAEARTTRHLGLCAELADLAMQLARGAAARTAAGWAEPEAPPMAAPHADPAPAIAPAGGAGRANPPTKQTEPAVLFTRLAGVVRDCIALEARLAGAPAAAAPTHARALLLRADPRRALLREAFGRAIDKHPDRADLVRETTSRLDDELAADPDQITHPGHLFFAICEALGIDINVAILPDELLYAAPATNSPGDEPHYASAYRFDSS